ncbi:stemmadenine O-acetyltransferase-like [Tripterygium wilfordii]|uniref:stemmadenine O-acetyltransferase-like n=1 Tax=Tripterygium wilfordii TaxID=458696 RepID=UPI0018F84FEF|nr:stemmadenine O-acetyltransferase-like [Tripterygium wilfordii]
MEVDIISRQCIKPSSPTPNHLTTFNISLLDQFAPHLYVPHLLFYPPSKASISETSKLFKQSLSKTLALYYPLAGKAKNSLSIDCNDEGASYITARVNRHLSDCLKQPTLSTVSNFLPSGITFTEVKPGAHVVVIQETLFSCGCVAIALVFPHSIMDAISLSGFMKTWATIARQQSSIGANLSPNFSASSIFPQTSTAFPEDLTALNLSSVYRRNGKFFVNRFVFGGSTITKLKAEAMSSAVQNPTRVEVVFAMLLKCIMSALRVKSGKQKPALAINAVNLRRKAVPPYPETAVGNFIWIEPIFSRVGDLELCDFVQRIRESVSSINGDFVKSLEGDGGFNILCESLKEIDKSCSKALSEGAEPIGLNSWCNMGFYEADFGWGKPLWIPFFLGLSEPPNAFFIYLMDTRHGNGIEAWVVLDEEIMPMLQLDMELRSLVSLDPSPLEIGLLSCINREVYSIICDNLQPATYGRIDVGVFYYLCEDRTGLDLLALLLVFYGTI